MTDHTQQFEREWKDFKEKCIIPSFEFDPLTDEVIDPMLAKEVFLSHLAQAERWGALRAVEYIDSQFDDSRYVSNGEWEKLLEEAKNLQ